MIRDALDLFGWRSLGVDPPYAVHVSTGDDVLHTSSSSTDEVIGNRLSFGRPSNAAIQSAPIERSGNASGRVHFPDRRKTHVARVRDQSLHRVNHLVPNELHGVKSRARRGWLVQDW